MIGQHHQGVLVALVDRVSKFTLIKKVDSKHADVVTGATITFLKPYLDKTLTITADNRKNLPVMKASQNNWRRRSILPTLISPGRVA